MQVDGNSEQGSRSGETFVLCVYVHSFVCVCVCVCVCTLMCVCVYIFVIDGNSGEQARRMCLAQHTDMALNVQLKAMRESGLLPQVGSEEERAALQGKAHNDAASKAVAVEDVIDPKLVSKAKFKHALRAFGKEEPGPKTPARKDSDLEQQLLPGTPGFAATKLRRSTFGFMAEPAADTTQTAPRASWRPDMAEPARGAPMLEPSTTGRASMLEPSTTAAAIEPSKTASVLGQIGRV
jgi:hypothetical protein